MHRFLVKEPPSEGRTRLRGSALRHLGSVLRLSAGDRIELFDGEGRAWLAEIRSIGRGSAELAIVGEVAWERESPLALTLAVALSRGGKLDWVVEKATELGVARIVPFVSERTVPDPADRSRRVGRWRRIAEAAAAQSGRSRTPAIDDVADFDGVITSAGAHDAALFFWEECSEGTPLSLPAAPVSALVVTGPEGGFTTREVDAARRGGFHLIGLGPRTLRAETAAIVAASVCQLRWGDLMRPSRA